MDITPEMRAAVLAAECAAQGGHLFDISQLITPDADGHTMAVRARDVDALPHIRCQRCGRVWLVVAEGESYEAAEADLAGQLRPDRQRPTRAARRAARQQKEAAREARRDEAERPAAGRSSGQQAAAPVMPTPVEPRAS